MKKHVLILLMLSALMACAAPVPPTVDLNPQPRLQPYVFGHGQVVQIKVIDARQAGYNNVKINPQQNITTIFTQQLARTLSAYQFKPITTPAPVQLTLRILQINYSTASGYFGSNTQTVVTAQISAKTSAGIYQQTYTASAYDDQYLKYGKQTPNGQINHAIDQLLTHLFNDQVLWQFLAR